MRPSATTELAVHMAVAARQLSMTHQLRPTLPSITWEAVPASTAGSALTTFNDASTAGHATITNHGGDIGGETIFNGSSTADSSILIANGGCMVLAVRLFLMVLRRVAPRG